MKRESPKTAKWVWIGGLAVFIVWWFFLTIVWEYLFKYLPDAWAAEVLAWIITIGSAYVIWKFIKWFDDNYMHLYADRFSNENYEKKEFENKINNQIINEPTSTSSTYSEKNIITSDISDTSITIEEGERDDGYSFSDLLTMTKPSGEIEYSETYFMPKDDGYNTREDLIIINRNDYEGRITFKELEKFLKDTKTENRYDKLIEYLEKNTVKFKKDFLIN
tara:strand:- start:512 stop:1171 length:660 start_codon:yes stop_codon:yes gene_type:complete